MPFFLHMRKSGFLMRWLNYRIRFVLRRYVTLKELYPKMLNSWALNIKISTSLYCASNIAPSALSICPLIQRGNCQYFQSCMFSVISFRDPPLGIDFDLNLRPLGNDELLGRGRWSESGLLPCGAVIGNMSGIGFFSQASS